MKKSLKTIICSVALAVSVSSIACAKELSPLTVNKNKSFIVTFNKEVDCTTINNKTIKVLDSQGKEVSILVETKADNKRVAIVSPQSEGYKEGETYSLVIGKGIKDNRNSNLNEETTMSFTVSSKNEDEIFIDNLYYTNSPYWNQGIKFVDGKLNLKYYDYNTKQTTLKTLSTQFNPNINKQTMDVFKSLYTEEEGLKTYVSYSLGNNNTGLSKIELYGDNLTVGGEAFAEFMFFDSEKSTSSKARFTVSIPQCTKENYSKNNYRIKNGLASAINDNYSAQIFNYINTQYTNTVLSGNYKHVVISKTFGQWKVIINSYNKWLYAEIIKL